MGVAKKVFVVFCLQTTKVGTGGFIKGSGGPPNTNEGASEGPSKKDCRALLFEVWTKSLKPRVRALVSGCEVRL